MQITSVNFITTKNPDALKLAVKEGPVVAVLYADIDLIYYQSGIIDTDTCTSATLQPVLVVGFDTENDIEYFIVKNSWGTSWGEKGYARIAVKPNVGVCGIQTDLILLVTN